MTRFRTIALYLNILLFVASTLLLSLQGTFQQDRKKSAEHGHALAFNKTSDQGSSSPQQVGENNEKENEGNEVEKASSVPFFLFDQILAPAQYSTLLQQDRGSKIDTQPIYLGIRNLRI